MNEIKLFFFQDFIQFRRGKSDAITRITWKWYTRKFINRNAFNLKRNRLLQLRNKNCKIMVVTKGLNFVDY